MKNAKNNYEQPEIRRISARERCAYPSYTTFRVLATKVETRHFGKGCGAWRKKSDGVTERVGIDRGEGSEHNSMYVNPAEV